MGCDEKGIKQMKTEGGNTLAVWLRLLLLSAVKRVSEEGTPSFFSFHMKRKELPSLLESFLFHTNTFAGI